MTATKSNDHTMTTATDTTPEVTQDTQSISSANNIDSNVVTEKLSKQDRVRRWFYITWSTVGAIVLTAVILYLLKILSLPVSMIIWTLVIVFCLRGIVSGLEKRGLNRGIGTTISYLILLAVLAIIGMLAFSPIFGLNDQFANIISNIPRYVDALKSYSDDLYSQYNHWLNSETVQSMMKSAEQSVGAWVSSFASNAATTVVDMGSTIVASLTAIGFALVIAFWVLLELPMLGAEMKRIIPPKRLEDARFLHFTFTKILGGYIKATLLQCFIIGLACGILFAIIGIPDAAALGVITGTMNIIPIIGPWIGGAFAAVMAIFVSPLTAIIALIGTIVIQQFVYTFVSPKIMQSSVDIHPAMTLLAMMIGSAIGGAMSGVVGSIVGMLFAIPAVAVLKSVFIYYFERKTQRQIVSEDGFFFKGDPGNDEEFDPFVDATNGRVAVDKKNKTTKIEGSWFERIREKRTASKKASDDESSNNKTADDQESKS